MAAKSLWYSFVTVHLKSCLDIFFRRIESTGSENIPKNKPVIFASNHTNALLDPLVIAYFSGKQQYFMTRGDVFNNKWLDKIFRSWKMLPVFRMKDGKETMVRNDAVSEFVSGELLTGDSIIIFPEASHFWEQTVQPLRKGMVRLAFGVLDRDPESELTVIPVGLHFTDMVKVNQDVLVNFGEAISVKDYPRADSEQKTFVNFNRDLRERMKKLIVTIEKNEFYETNNRLRKELQRSLRHEPLIKVYNLEKKLIQKLEELQKKNKLEISANESLMQVLQSLELQELRDEYLLMHPDFGKDSRLLEVLKFPLYLLAFFNHLPVWLMLNILLKKVKDRTFHNSIKFGFGIILAPFFAVIQSAIIAAVSGNIWMGLGYLFAYPAFSVILADFLGKRDYRF